MGEQGWGARVASPWAVFLGLAIAAGVGIESAWAQEVERHAISANDVAIYNLVGAVRIEGGSGPSVVITLERGGKDAARLQVATGRIDGRETLRIIYPGNRVFYPGTGRFSGTDVRVLDDGTFYDRKRSGRRVRIGGRGIGGSGGVEAHANLTIQVPAGHRLAVYLAVGQVEVANVDGELTVETGSAPVTTVGTRGHLLIDTGAGRVSVTDAEGDVEVDTGSGAVDLSRIRGTRLLVDTGSGRVTGKDIEVEELEVDTGSGGIQLAATRALEIVLDTGSGRVDLDLLSETLRRLVIDTGSGSVRVALPPTIGASLLVDTGSGGVNVDLPLRMLKRSRSTLEGELGDGSGVIRIDTGSGSVRITERAARGVAATP